MLKNCLEELISFKNIRPSHRASLAELKIAYKKNVSFFGKSDGVTELTFWSPNFMQKIRKILGAVSEFIQSDFG